MLLWEVDDEGRGKGGEMQVELTRWRMVGVRMVEVKMGQVRMG